MLLPQMLLGFAGGLIAVSAIASMAALRLQKRQARVAGRIAIVIEGHNWADLPEEARRSARLQSSATPLLRRAARLIGYETERTTKYPVKWWIVIPACCVLARLGAQLLIPLIGWLALALVPVGAVVLTRTFYKRCVGRHTRALYMQFPDALAMIVRGVRVGIPVAESLRTIARESSEPTAPEFRRVADRVALGVPLEEALYEMAERTGLSEYRFFAIAIGLQAQTGGTLSETLENLADVIRKRVALRARGYALAAEARMSIMILCALPIITGLALSLINPHYIEQLFDNDLGRKVFGAAVISFCTGLGVMHLIVKKSLL